MKNQVILSNEIPECNYTHKSLNLVIAHNDQEISNIGIKNVDYIPSNCLISISKSNLILYAGNKKLSKIPFITHDLVVTYIDKLIAAKVDKKCLSEYKYSVGSRRKDNKLVYFIDINIIKSDNVGNTIAKDLEEGNL